MATTIKEIASLIGVSRGTVDRVLHNRGRVSPEVREKVYAAIKELGYEPNKAGRMLAAKKNPCCIGVFCPGSYNSFFDEIIRGMEEATEEYRDLGFSLKVSMVRGFDTEDHLKGLEDLVESGINALVSAPICNQQIIDYLSSLKIPSAVFNTDLENFFPSIEQPRVWKRFQLKPFNFKQPIANILAGLCCIKEKNEDGTVKYVVPQGAPTSPLITNAICDTLDCRLSGLARRFNLHYSRYADDITFSSMHNVYKEDGLGSILVNSSKLSYSAELVK